MIGIIARVVPATAILTSFLMSSAGKEPPFFRVIVTVGNAKISDVRNVNRS